MLNIEFYGSKLLLDLVLFLSLRDEFKTNLENELKIEIEIELNIKLKNFFFIFLEFLYEKLTTLL